MIRLTDVSKRFLIGKVQNPTILARLKNIFGQQRAQMWALRHLNIEIAHGESVAIIGPNGSGKSTLLGIMAGIFEPEEGRFETDEEMTPMLLLGIGFVLDLTARDNIYLYGAILGKNREYMSKRFHSILKFAELEKFEDTKVKDFSSGMFSRLAFSIIIHTDPQMLLIDEVLAVGDERFNEKCFKVIKRFQSEGKGMVFVSHDLEMVRKFFRRCIYIHNGKIIADGPTEKVIARYKSDMEHAK